MNPDELKDALDKANERIEELEDALDYIRRHADDPDAVRRIVRRVR
jgi:hypothetical protein